MYVCVGMCMCSSCLCFDASAIPWCTETWRKNTGFTKEVIFLTKPLILGIGASKLLPTFTGWSNNRFNNLLEANK